MGAAHRRGTARHGTARHRPCVVWLLQAKRPYYETCDPIRDQQCPMHKQNAAMALATLTAHREGKTKGCVDFVPQWTDSYKNSCNDYEARKFCSPDGDYGPGWAAYVKRGNGAT